MRIIYCMNDNGLNQSSTCNSQFTFSKFFNNLTDLNHLQKFGITVLDLPQFLVTLSQELKFQFLKFPLWVEFPSLFPFSLSFLPTIISAFTIHETYLVMGCLFLLLR